ncbi:MAG: WG repeat-containing protein [Bacteroidales bacterium]|jgi:hypothetical protein
MEKIKDLKEKVPENPKNNGLSGNTDETVPKATKRLVMASIVSAFVLLLIVAILGLKNNPFFLPKSPYDNTFYQYDLHKGYVVDYTEQYDRVLLNPKGKPVLFAQRFFYKENPTSEDSLFVYSKGGYRGYFNLNTGKEQIPVSDKLYLRAWFFDKKSGLAAVQDANSYKIGFINPSGQYIIQPQYKYVKGKDFAFKNDECVVYKDDGTCLLIDSEGKIILSGYEEISDLTNGHRVLTQNNKCGLWNDSLVLPIEFDDIYLYNSKIQLTQDNKCWSIDYDYKTIIDPYIFDNITSIANRFNSDSTTLQYFKSPKLQNLIICGLNNLEGLFDVKQQKIVVPIEWERIEVLKCADNEYALFGKKGNSYTLLK